MMLLRLSIWCPGCSLVAFTELGESMKNIKPQPKLSQHTSNRLSEEKAEVGGGKDTTLNLWKVAFWDIALIDKV